MTRRELSAPEGLGRAIRVLREERGLKRGDLAEDAGISYTHLAEIENAKKRPSASVLGSIAEALDVRPFEVMALADSLASGETSIAREAVYRLGETSRSGAMLMDPPPPPAAAAPAPSRRAMPARQRRGGTDQALTQLIELAKELPAEDLEAVLQLARHLAQRSL